MSESKKDTFASGIRNEEIKASKKTIYFKRHNRISDTITTLHNYAPQTSRVKSSNENKKLPDSNELYVSTKSNKYQELVRTGKIINFPMGTALYKDRYQPGTIFTVIDPNRTGKNLQVRTTDVKYKLENGEFGNEGKPAKKAQLLVSFERIDPEN
jgi:hypothetical protein